MKKLLVVLLMLGVLSGLIAQDTEYLRNRKTGLPDLILDSSTIPGDSVFVTVSGDTGIFKVVKTNIITANDSDNVNFQSPVVIDSNLTAKDIIGDTIYSIKTTTDIIHPNDSPSVSLCNHNNSSLLWLGDSIQKFGSLNAYFGAFKGIDLSMNNYYKNSVWYRTLDGNGTCAFQNYDNMKFEWYFAGYGVAGSTISWGAAMASLDSTGNFTVPIATIGDSLSVGGSAFVDSIISITDLTGNIANSTTSMDTIFVNEIRLDEYTQYFSIDPSNATVGVTAPTNTTIGTFRGLTFDADAEVAYFEFEIPDDWNGTSDLGIMGYFTNQPSTAIGAGETVIFDFEYRSIAEGETLTNGTAVTVSGTYTQSGAGTDGELIEGGVVIDYDNVNQPLTAGDLMGIKVNRDMTTDTYASDIIIVKWEITYTSNSILKHN